MAANMLIGNQATLIIDGQAPMRLHVRDCSMSSDALDTTYFGSPERVYSKHINISINGMLAERSTATRPDTDELASAVLCGDQAKAIGLAEIVLARSDRNPAIPLLALLRCWLIGHSLFSPVWGRDLARKTAEALADKEDRAKLEQALMDTLDGLTKAMGV